MLAKFFVSALILAGCSALASAQTDFALDFYGSFPSKTDSAGVTVSPATSAGGMIEVRHLKTLLGFEGTYSFNRANQRYNCGVSCGNISVATIKADAHEVTFDWVPSVRIANLRPFGVLGVGALFHVPQSSDQNLFETKTSTNVVYVYGAGLDVGLIPHFGLRFQYRGNVNKVPDLTNSLSSIDKFTHTSQPMIGIYIRL